MKKLTMLKMLMVAGLLAFPLVGKAAEDDARSILDKAIKASGGERALGSLKAPMMWMERGKYYLSEDEGTPYIGQYSSKWPAWYRMDIEGVGAITANAEKAWTTSPNGIETLDGNRLAERLMQVRVAWATRLFPLVDKAYQLSTIEGMEIDGKPTVGIKAVHTDGRDIKFFFDRKTHLLTKMETMVVSRAHGPEPVLSETCFFDHRNLAGVVMPSRFKLYHNKKLFAEAEVVDYKVFATLDPALFEAPK